MGGGWDEIVRAPPAPTAPSARVEVVGACATHVERPALGACTRCGTFVCGECARNGRAGALLCAPCEARERDVVPWEDPKVFFVAGFFKTLFAIVVRPHRFFARLPSGTWWKPALFSMLGAFALLLPMVVFLMFHEGTVFGGGTRIEGPEIVGGLIGVAIVAVAFAVANWMGAAAYGLVVHGAARAVGGTATLHETLRACAYASTAFWPWPLLLVSAKVLPDAVTGGIAVLTFVAMPLVASVGLAFHLSGRHGLRPLVAWAVAIGLALATNVGCCTILGVIGALTDGGG